MTAPARLASRAAVVIDFELAQIVAKQDDVEGVLDFLDADCERIRTPAGVDRWMLRDAARRSALASAGLTDLRQLRRRSRAAGQSLLQDTLDRSLAAGWTERDLQKLTPAEARALSVVASWWNGRRPEVPSELRMRRLADRLSLFSDVRAMADDHFIGRDQELAELRHRYASPLPLCVVHGPGGIGKSAVLARHIVWALDEARARVALLDFDDATLNPLYPGDLARRIIDLVSRQADGDEKQPLDRLRMVTGDIAYYSDFRTESSGRTSSGDSLDWEAGDCRPGEDERVPHPRRIRHGRARSAARTFSGLRVPLAD